MTDSLRHNISAPSIFVVDDDAALLNSLQFSLGVEGYDVATFSSGTAFLDAAGEVRGGCVLVDHHQGGTDGVHLAKELRSRGVNVPVIMIATHPSVDLLRRATAEGVRVIEKPLDAAVLRSAVHTAVSETSPLGNA